MHVARLASESANPNPEPRNPDPALRKHSGVSRCRESGYISPHTDAMKQVHTFQGYTLTLERDGDTVYADIERGRFAGSLSLADDTGTLEDGDETIRIPRAVVDHFIEIEERF